MVEVFKTNINDKAQANILIRKIERAFNNQQVNFDLNDCDRILRVKCNSGLIQAQAVITLVKDFGYEVAILPDILIPVNDISTIPFCIQRACVK